MITNLTKEVYIARNPFYATTLFSRLRGMILRDFEGFDAMVFNNCSAVHTMFMTVKIDVLFVDIENSVCGFREHLVPWVPAACCRSAVCVIELPAGTIERTGTGEGDLLDLNAELGIEGKKRRKEMLRPAGIAVPMESGLNR
ncbi:MAG: DUF192 domain-containing protein [Victivallales bacterium]|nr:DUF192 domain-containing protein [Victivallales bacterium]